MKNNIANLFFLIALKEAFIDSGVLSKVVSSSQSELKSLLQNSTPFLECIYSSPLASRYYDVISKATNTFHPKDYNYITTFEARTFQSNLASDIADLIVSDYKEGSMDAELQSVSSVINPCIQQAVPEQSLALTKSMDSFLRSALQERRHKSGKKQCVNVITESQVKEKHEKNSAISKNTKETSQMHQKQSTGDKNSGKAVRETNTYFPETSDSKKGSQRQLSTVSPSVIFQTNSDWKNKQPLLLQSTNDFYPIWEEPRFQITNLNKPSKLAAQHFSQPPASDSVRNVAEMDKHKLSLSNEFLPSNAFVNAEPDLKMQNQNFDPMLSKKSFQSYYNDKNILQQSSESQASENPFGGQSKEVNLTFQPINSVFSMVPIVLQNNQSPFRPFQQNFQDKTNTNTQTAADSDVFSFQTNIQKPDINNEVAPSFTENTFSEKDIKENQKTATDVLTLFKPFQSTKNFNNQSNNVDLNGLSFPPVNTFEENSWWNGHQPQLLTSFNQLATLPKINSNDLLPVSSENVEFSTDIDTNSVALQADKKYNGYDVTIIHPFTDTMHQTQVQQSFQKCTALPKIVLNEFGSALSESVDSSSENDINSIASLDDEKVKTYDVNTIHPLPTESSKGCDSLDFPSWDYAAKRKERTNEHKTFQQFTSLPKTTLNEFGSALSESVDSSTDNDIVASHDDEKDNNYDVTTTHLLPTVSSKGLSFDFPSWDYSEVRKERSKEHKTFQQFTSVPKITLNEFGSALSESVESSTDNDINSVSLQDDKKDNGYDVTTVNPLPTESSKGHDLFDFPSWGYSAKRKDKTKGHKKIGIFDFSSVDYSEESKGRTERKNTLLSKSKKINKDISSANHQSSTNPKIYKKSKKLEAKDLSYPQKINDSENNKNHLVKKVDNKTEKVKNFSDSTVSKIRYSTNFQKSAKEDGIFNKKGNKFLLKEHRGKNNRHFNFLKDIEKSDNGSNRKTKITYLPLSKKETDKHKHYFDSLWNSDSFEMSTKDCFLKEFEEAFCKGIETSKVLIDVFNRVYGSKSASDVYINAIKKTFQRNMTSEVISAANAVYSAIRESFDFVDGKTYSQIFGMATSKYLYSKGILRSDNVQTLSKTFLKHINSAVMNRRYGEESFIEICEQGFKSFMKSFEVPFLESYLENSKYFVRAINSMSDLQYYESQDPTNSNDDPIYASQASKTKNVNKMYESRALMNKNDNTIYKPRASINKHDNTLYEPAASTKKNDKKIYHPRASMNENVNTIYDPRASTDENDNSIIESRSLTNKNDNTIYESRFSTNVNDKSIYESRCLTNKNDNTIYESRASITKNDNTIFGQPNIKNMKFLNSSILEEETPFEVLEFSSEVFNQIYSSESRKAFFEFRSLKPSDSDTISFAVLKYLKSKGVFHASDISETIRNVINAESSKISCAKVIKTLLEVVGLVLCKEGLLTNKSFSKLATLISKNLNSVINFNSSTQSIETLTNALLLGLDKFLLSQNISLSNTALSMTKIFDKKLKSKSIVTKTQSNERRKNSSRNFNIKVLSKGEGKPTSGRVTSVSKRFSAILMDLFSASPLLSTFLQYSLTDNAIPLAFYKALKIKTLTNDETNPETFVRMFTNVISLTTKNPDKPMSLLKSFSQNLGDLLVSRKIVTSQNFNKIAGDFSIKLESEFQNLKKPADIDAYVKLLVKCTNEFLNGYLKFNDDVSATSMFLFNILPKTRLFLPRLIRKVSPIVLSSKGLHSTASKNRVRNVTMSLGRDIAFTKGSSMNITRFAKRLVSVVTQMNQNTDMKPQDIVIETLFEFILALINIINASSVGEVRVEKSHSVYLKMIHAITNTLNS